MHYLSVPPVKASRSQSVEHEDPVLQVSVDSAEVDSLVVEGHGQSSGCGTVVLDTSQVG